MRNYRKRQEGEMTKRLFVCTSTLQMSRKSVHLFQQNVHLLIHHQAADRKTAGPVAINGHDLLYAVRITPGKNVLGNDFTKNNTNNAGNTGRRKSEILFRGDLRENSGT